MRVGLGWRGRRIELAEMPPIDECRREMFAIVLHFTRCRPRFLPAWLTRLCLETFHLTLLYISLRLVTACTTGPLLFTVPTDRTLNFGGGGEETRVLRRMIAILCS